MRPATSVAALLVLLLAACAPGATIEETAPPPTPLPELRTPTTILGPTDSAEPSLRPTLDTDAAYQQLLASVPATIVGRCERVDAGRAAVAAVSCSPASGADRVAYRLFETEAAMTEAYRMLVDGLPRSALEGPGCGRGPGSERVPNGRKACYRSDGGTTVTWTNELVYILATASRADTDWAALDRFWADAGPITP
jgi:hypothetical protein